MSKIERRYVIECCMRGLPLSAVGLMVFTELHKKAPVHAATRTSKIIKRYIPFSIAQLMNLSIRKD